MNRRHFLATGSALAAAALPGARSLRAWRSASPDPKALAHAALEAARAAGARYADVIFRGTQVESWGQFSAWSGDTAYEAFTQGVGVRALTDGCWGIAAMDGVATTDDVVRLGREAAAEAAVGAKGGGGAVELAPVPSVANGHWVTPIERDPFMVPAAEKLDFLVAMNDFARRIARDVGRVESSLMFQRNDTTMASTEGTDYTQTTYLTGGRLELTRAYDCLQDSGYCQADFLTPVGAGWEYIRATPFRDAAFDLLDVARRTSSMTTAAVELGRYDVVFDAYAMAGIVSATLGAATAVDRAMGLTDRGVGTSYLADPLGMLGDFRAAAPGVTITADRSQPTGAATVAWDDEGVAPTDTRLVTDGILTDFQTTRESATWLAPYYRRAGRPVRSNGCAGRVSATAFPAQAPANLTLAPGREALSFEDLVKSTKRGYAICGTGGGGPWTDWQAATGVGRGYRVYAIRDGQLGAALTPYRANYLFGSSELWKNVVALGGRASARAFGIESDGPARTVVAVPAKVAQVRFIDPMGTR